MRRVYPLALLLCASTLAIIVPPADPIVKGGPIVSGDLAWMMTAAGLVLLMTPGLSFFYGGMVQKKNVISTMLQSLMAMIVISIVWIVFGFSLAFGDDIGGVIGNPATFFMFRHVGTATHPALAPTIPLVIFALFHLKFAIITPALITGSFAERVRFWAVVMFTVLFSIFIYCPLAHATSHPDGFLASAAAALAWISYDVIRGRKASALGACIGAVVGLVAITPAAGYVSVAQSIVIGTFSSIISNVAVYWKSRSTLDDTLDVFPCHGVGGMVGMIATGVFAADVGLIHGDSKVFLVQLLTLAIAAPYAFIGSWVLYRVTDAIIPLRVSERQELIGLDITQHDETVSSRGVRTALEALQGELFGRPDV